MRRTPLRRKTPLIARTRLTTTAKLTSKPAPRGPAVVPLAIWQAPRLVREPAPAPPPARAAQRANISVEPILKGPDRVRSARHLRFVAGHACLICGTTPCQAHHLTHAQEKARGLKSGDQWTVPLCPGHHHALHAAGGERDWWSIRGIDALEQARLLWSSSPANGH